MKQWIAILILIFVVTGVDARLGETEEQFKARYGVPKAEVPSPGSDKTFSYSKDGVGILGEFVNGKCLRVGYNVPWDNPSGKLQQAAFDTIFKAEGGSIWANYPGGKPNQFVRSDSLATAETGGRYGMNKWVTFTLTQWTKLNEQAVKAQAVAKKAAEDAAHQEQKKKLANDF